MSFVRMKKTTAGSIRHYLVENVRVDGKVRQRVICYLGNYTSVDEALAKLPGDIEKVRAEVARREAREKERKLQPRRRSPWWARPAMDFSNLDEILSREYVSDSQAELSRLERTYEKLRALNPVVPTTD